MLRCRTLGRSRPRLAGLVPLMGKAWVSNIMASLGFVVIPTALAMPRLSAVAGLFAILPSFLSRFRPLVPYYYNPLPGWHPTAHHWLAPYCYRSGGITSARWLRSPIYPSRLSYSSSVTPSRGIALPRWLPPTAWCNRCNYRHGCCFSVRCRPTVSVVFLYARSLSSPSRPERALAKLSFILGSLRMGLGLSNCIFL